MDVYISWAADLKQDEQGAILSNEPDRLRGISQRIEQGREVWRSWAESHGGSIINSEGPFGRVMVPAEHLDRLKEIREQYAGKLGTDVSVGVGMKLEEADKALALAQKRGLNTILFFSPALEEQEQKKAAEKAADPVAQLAAEHTKKSEPLDKAFVTRAQLAAMGAGAALALSPSTTSNDAQPPAPVVEQAAPVPEPKKWSYDGLHEDLHPIAHLESSGGENVQHAAHSKGSFHTALGALGLKPVTAWDQYQRDATLKQRFPGLDTPEAFEQKLAQDPDLYNSVAGSEWQRIKTRVGGSLASAAYAWRRGLTSALRAKPEQIQQDPYVAQYLQLRQKPVQKAEGPALNQGAGAGVAGPAGAAPASVMKRPVEGSEHTQGEAAQALFNEQHRSPEMTRAGKDMKEILYQHAQAQHDEDDQKQQTEKTVADMKARIVGILQQVKAAAPAIEELRQSSPDVFKAVAGSVEALLVMAQQLDQLQKQQQSGTVQKSMTDADGQVLEKGVKLPMPGAPPRHHVNLPVGSSKLGAAPDPKKGTGKHKVQHGDGKAGWIQARAGQVLSQERDKMGNPVLPHPISSLNPKGH